MPRGGKRAGAGRKPNDKGAGGNVVGFPAGAMAGAQADAAVDPLAAPPADMVEALAIAEAAAAASPSSDAARVCATLTARMAAWSRYAPLAIHQATLVPSTVPGFRELCEQVVLKEELAAKLARFGVEGKPGADRLRHYTRLAQRVDASLARFKLTAFGKPDDDAGAATAKRTASNPWAQVGG